jgi:hypothetical protein
MDRAAPDSPRAPDRAASTDGNMTDQPVRAQRPEVSNKLYPVASLAQLARAGAESSVLQATRLAARRQAVDLPVQSQKATDALNRLRPEPLVHDDSLSDVVVCDLDGTLAIVTGRSPFAAQFCERDVLDTDVLAIAQAAGPPLMLVSGRSERFRPQTERWLAANNVQYAELLMRPIELPQASDVVVKVGLVDHHIRGQFNVALSLDDRNQVVQMWRALGIDCLQVAPGDF